ncbi:MAG TPA: RNA 2',3'-cyclic phosphodiesterase [Thermoanaerobaculia bacterium]|nr:RNA 2',3'-cyclic phosphodiesterase [Thermoanaerobaculia bacterium]
MNERERVRAFFAVPSDPGWIDSARGLLDRIRPTLPEASWTRPETWHLTLRFLGDVSREFLAAFGAEVSLAVAGCASLDLSTGAAVVFPPRGPARVLGVGFGPEVAGLSGLVAQAERIGTRLGLAPEPRPFHPHVTFARLRRGWPVEAIRRFCEHVGGWTFPVWPVRSCAVYESRLTPQGAVHTPVSRWDLAAPAGISA